MGEEFAGAWPITPGPFGQTLVDEYPEIEASVRLWKKQYAVMDQNRTLHPQTLFAADKSIFSFFDFGLEKGDENTALSDPKAVVLTSKLASKYFGHDDVIGQTITFLRGGELEEFKITGILAPVPLNSHVQFEMLFSMELYVPHEFMKSWDGNFLYTYIKLSKGTNRDELETKFSPFMAKYRTGTEDFEEALATVDDRVRLRLKAINEIHLNPTVEWEIGPQGNKSSVYIFASIAILILLVAGMNFTNLSIAKASKRIKEVGIRKSMGASYGDLLRQFLSESVLMSLLALIIALLSLKLFLPLVNDVSGKNIEFATILELGNLLVLSAAAGLTGLLAGMYPALYLIKFRATEAVKGNKGKTKSFVRSSLVTAQFVITIGLIISTITIKAQLDFVKNKTLGFEKENVINIPLISFSNEDYGNILSFKNELLYHEQIKNVTVSSRVPGDLIYGDQAFTLKGADDPFNLTHFSVGFDFVDTYKLALVAGRNFSHDYGSDTLGTIILNESAVRKMGLTSEDAIGKIMDDNLVVGVVEDFHFKTLKKEIEPLVLILNPENTEYISIRISDGDPMRSLELIDEVYTASFSDKFHYTFLDSKLNTLYESDSKAQSLFILFSSFSILLACMGLFGLVAFSSEERTKEMGVRKVLGASARHIRMMFLQDFSKWILISNIVAWPLAYVFLQGWLGEFAYRVEITFWVFILASVLTISLAVITVLFQADKAARLNPVKSLRSE